MMDLEDIAKTYVGTPHINGGNVKGAGLDCCTLPAHILSEFYNTDFAIKFGYPADWFCRRGCDELLLPYLEQYCERVDEAQPGDVLSYAFGRAQYAHLALYLGDEMCIHCMADDGTKIISTNASCFYYPNGQSRLTGIWRLKHELSIRRR